MIYVDRCENKLGTTLNKRHFANNIRLEMKIEKYVAMAKLMVLYPQQKLAKFKKEQILYMQPITQGNSKNETKRKRKTRKTNVI